MWWGLSIFNLFYMIPSIRPLGMGGGKINSSGLFRRPAQYTARPATPSVGIGAVRQDRQAAKVDNNKTSLVRQRGRYSPVENISQDQRDENRHALAQRELMIKKAQKEAKQNKHTITVGVGGGYNVSKTERQLVALKYKNLTTLGNLKKEDIKHFAKDILSRRAKSKVMGSSFTVRDRRLLTAEVKKDEALKKHWRSVKKIVDNIQSTSQKTGGNN